MSTKVLVVVDVQNDFVKRGVLPYGYPEKSNTPDIESYVFKTVMKGDYVVATRDTHHDNYLETLEGQKLPVKHCIHQTFGWELTEGVRASYATGKIVVFDKQTFGTALVAEYIKGLIDGGERIEEVELVGYMASICVLANAVILRSRFPNMRIKVLKDYCGDVDEASFNAAMIVLEKQQIDVV